MNRAYQVITDRVIALLESGTVPWHRPWGGAERRPRNLASDRPYRGINVFLLAAASYEAPYWLTFKQARDRGGSVKKGEHGFPCIFWNWIERTDADTGEVEKRPFLKYYTVFNVEQCADVPYPSAPTRENSFSPIEACERIVSGMPQAPPVRHGGARAYYDPSTDEVGMPPRERFDGPEAYYGVLFHELVHSTGHESRLDRPGITGPIVFGSRDYSREELVAEMGATFLCGDAGIDNAVIDNSASYIASWLRRLRNDTKLVVQAAGRSQRAADYILDRAKGGSEKT